jgi:hypothetical protein
MDYNEITRPATFLLPTRLRFPIGICFILGVWKVFKASSPLRHSYKAFRNRLSFMRSWQEGLIGGHVASVYVTTSPEQRLTRAPFSAVHASKAIQKPTADGGSVYRNVESLWIGTGSAVQYEVTSGRRNFTFTADPRLFADDHGL